MREILRKNLPGVLTLIFLGIYLFFPCGFSTTDAWHYAACIKYNTGLFHPFHLLYNVTGWLFCFLPLKAGVDTLASLKTMNAIFAALSVYVVVRIIRLTGKKESVALLTAALCGTSFSVMRYATENETYIIPLFFGLVSLLYLYRYLISGKRSYEMISVFMASLAVLFHFSYIFWWACIIISAAINGKWKILLISLTISFIIPVSYFIVLLETGIQPDSEFLTELADIEPLKKLFGVSLTGIFLSVVNLLRSFIQVHGYLFNMLKENILWMIPGIISICLFLVSFIQVKNIRINNRFSQFAAINAIIAGLMFLFAVFSKGNAEFMVMIPVLLIISTGVICNGVEKSFSFLLAGLLIWNLFYGIIPLNRQVGITEEYLCEKILHEDNAVVIARDDQLIVGMIFYKTGEPGWGNILKSPAVIQLKGGDLESLLKIIDNSLSEGRKIYTDCLSIMPLSRSVLLEGELNRQFFDRYEIKEEMKHHDIFCTKRVHSIIGDR